MASMRGAAAFLKSVDCTDHIAGGKKKDAAYIAYNVISAENKFGAQVVDEVIMDGGNHGANKATHTHHLMEFPRFLLFSELVDFEQNMEFWMTAKGLVELSVPAMNLFIWQRAIS